MKQKITRGKTNPGTNKITKALKLPLLNLNVVKAEEFLRFEVLNTTLANRILALSDEQKRSLSSKDFSDLELGSSWVNQTIRNVQASEKTKAFKSLPLETNNQNWSLHKVGETWSVSFNLIRGTRNRVPVNVHASSHVQILEKILNGEVKAGSFKLWRSRKGTWYVCISVTWDVPVADNADRWVGCDRGQNIPLVAATPDGPIIFYQARKIRHIRRVYAARRAMLQKLGKTRAVKKLENKEARIVKHINHCLSKDLVALAVRCNAGIRLEDLSGIRNATQRRSAKSDAGLNRDAWPFYQLERFIQYKASSAGVRVQKVPAAYTTQACNHCGALNKRKKHSYVCSRCGHKAHADGNASQNVRDAETGRFCLLVLEAPEGGCYDGALNEVRNEIGNNLVSRTRTAKGA